MDVTVAEPIVLMPGAPAGVAPTAAGLKIYGEQQQQTSAVVTSPPAVPVPVDVPDVVAAPPTFVATPPPLLPRRAASEPVVPTGSVGCHRSSRLALPSHPRAEATAHEFLQWMQRGTERQAGWHADVLAVGFTIWRCSTAASMFVSMSGTKLVMNMTQPMTMKNQRHT